MLNEYFGKWIYMDSEDEDKGNYFNSNYWNVQVVCINKAEISRDYNPNCKMSTNLPKSKVFPKICQQNSKFAYVATTPAILILFYLDEDE